MPAYYIIHNYSHTFILCHRQGRFRKPVPSQCPFHSPVKHACAFHSNIHERSVKGNRIQVPLGLKAISFDLGPQFAKDNLTILWSKRMKNAKRVQKSWRLTGMKWCARERCNQMGLMEGDKAQTLGQGGYPWRQNGYCCRSRWAPLYQFPRVFDSSALPHTLATAETLL